MNAGEVHIMIDCETLGTRPGCPVLSVGAVAFDPYAPFDRAGATAYESSCSLESAMSAGLVPEAGAIGFWMRQPDEARLKAFGHGNEDRQPLAGMLSGLSLFILETAEAGGGSSDRVKVWAHGKDFDPLVLRAAYEAVDRDPPWEFRATMDTRTAFAMAGVSYRGTAHAPLEDCYGQCGAVCRAYAALGLHRGSAGNGLDVDGLAQEIRRVDGSNSLGAGELAERLAGYLSGKSRAGLQ